MTENIEDLAIEWAEWSRLQFTSLGYPRQSVDASHAQGAYEYTKSKGLLRQIQAKVRSKQPLTEQEYTMLAYYKLHGEAMPTAMAIATDTGKKVRNMPINRAAERIERAVVELMSIDKMAANVLVRFYVFEDSPAQIARNLDRVCKVKKNGRTYIIGDNKWGGRAVERALNALERVLNNEAPSRKMA